MAAPNEITSPQLSRLIGTPACPYIFDIRLKDDFDLDQSLIPSAIRIADYTKFNDLVPRSMTLDASARLVIVCHQGHKLSQGLAAILRNQGLQTEYLSGEHVEWAASGLPTIPFAIIPADKTGAPKMWVTRHRPKIDRVACPWLIRRFVDRQAKFLFVAPDEVIAVAEKFDATPFDIEGVFWSHRNDRCSFDTMVEEFQLTTEPLAILSKIFRGADTNKLELAPQCAGLLAFAVGTSRMYRDDLALIDNSMQYYDSLYRWARDGMTETHDWVVSNG